MVAAEELRRAVQREVGPALEWAHVDRGCRRRVHHDPRWVRGRRIEVRHRQERVGRRLEPDQVRVGRRRPGLVELDEAHSPPLERGEERRRPVVGALGQRDRLPGLEQPEHERRRRPCTGREEERLAALELRQRSLCGQAVGMSVALVVELSRLAFPVRPDRRAIKRFHGSTLVPATLPI